VSTRAAYAPVMPDRHAGARARVVVRPCRDDEIDDVLALWREAGTLRSAWDDPDALRTLLDHDEQSLLVAAVDGRIVGSLIAAWDGWRANLYRLVVAASSRRRRIGAALLREAERRLTALGVRRISALASGDDDRATAFWRAADYRHDEAAERFVKNLEASA
jgi:ribosomal protein S18 acetylase RimI-like enzyme